MVDEPEYQGGHEPEPEDATAEQQNLTQLIDELLADNRPERYDKREQDWQDPVIAKVTDLLKQEPVEETAHDSARRRVHAREGEAIRKLRRILREIFDNGQLPVGWGEGEWKQLYLDVLHLPLAVGNGRVRFGSATPADWEQWTAEDQEQADKRMAADQRTNNGGRMIRQWMLEQGVERTEDLRQIESQ